MEYRAGRRSTASCGLTTTEILTHVSPGGVRALHIMGENPMMSEPNLNSHASHDATVGVPGRRRTCSSTSRARLPMFSCRRLRGRRKKARSPTPTGGFSACAKRWSRAGSRDPIGRSSVILPRASKRSLAGPDTPSGPTSSRPKCSKRWVRWCRNTPASNISASRSQGLQTPVWDDSHPGTPFLFAETFPSGSGKFHPLEYVPAVEMPDEEYPVHPHHRTPARTLARRHADAPFEARRAVSGSAH